MSDRPMHTVPGAFEKLRALYAQGEEALSEHRFEDAVAAFTEGLSIDDHFRQRYVTMYAQRGFARQQLGDHAGAVDDYGKAIALEEPPQNQAQYHFYRGMCLAALGDARAAVDEHTRSIALYPDHPGPYHLRGKLYAGVLERFAEAEADFDRLLALSPHPEGYQLRGYCKLRLGRAPEALADIQRARETAPNPYTSYLLAWAGAETDDAALLFEAMEETLAAAPEYREYFASNDAYARYRADPRFRRLLGDYSPSP